MRVLTDTPSASVAPARAALAATLARAGVQTRIWGRDAAVVNARRFSRMTFAHRMRAIGDELLAER